MRLAFPALLLLDVSLFGQTSADTIAERMLGRIGSVRWGAPYVASKPAACQPKTFYQQTFGAADQWSDSCVLRTDGLIEESFFYAFDESGPLRLKMEVRPEPPADIEVARALCERLTQRFGSPAREATMMQVGLPFAGEHWASAKLHYFLFQNPIGMHVGVKGPVQLIVVDTRLFKEFQKDVLIRQADVLFYPPSPARPFLQQILGEPYIRLIDAYPKTPSERESVAQQISGEVLRLLGAATRALLDERAMLLLAANGLVAKLSTLLWEVANGDNRDAAATAAIRARLAKFDVKLGGVLHDGGLAYNQDLLWRVWREFPDSQAGHLVFLELQQRGWYTGSLIGCPANPDLFHDVIEHGEAFLAQYPAAQFRKEVLFTLAVANESWWSVAHAPADDGWLEGIPYPRKDINKRQAAAARERAINYYQEIVNLAPESAEAASAKRRLPRLKLGLDTAQRRFFCSYD